MATTSFLSSRNAAKTANTTNYNPLSVTNSTSSATETQKQTLYRQAGTCSNLGVHVATNTLTATTNVIYRNTTVSGNQNVPIGSGLTGDFTDPVNTDANVSGDKLDIQTVTGATGTSINIIIYGINFSASSGTYIRYDTVVVGNQFNAASTTYFQNIIAADSTSNTTENLTQVSFKTNGTLRDLCANVYTNPKAANSTFRSRIGGGNGNLAAIVTSSGTGFFEDAINIDVITSGTLVNYAYVTGAATGSVGWVAGAAFVPYNDNLKYPSNAYSSALSPTTTATTDNYGLGGAMTGGAESSNSFYLSTNTVISNMYTFVQANAATTGTGSFLLRVAAANGNALVVIAPAFTGYVEDSVNTDVVNSTQKVNTRLTNSTDNTITLSFAGAHINLPAVSGIGTGLIDHNQYSCYWG